MSAKSSGPGGEVLVYEAADGSVRVDVRLEQDTVWLTQAQMAELFGRERSVITKHINNVFREGELTKKSNVQNLHVASSDKPVAAFSVGLEALREGWRARHFKMVELDHYAGICRVQRVMQPYLEAVA